MDKYIDQILHCDCVQGMRALPAACIPLTVTSPPYDKIRRYGGHTFDFPAIAAQLWRITMDGGVLVWIIQDQVIKGGESGTSASHVVQFRQIGFRLHQTIIIRTSDLRHCHPNRYYRNFHYAFVFSRGKPSHVNRLTDRRNSTWKRPIRKRNWRSADGTPHSIVIPTMPVRKWGVRGSVWDYTVGYRKSTQDTEAHQVHPALMPESLAEDHILSWSRPGDLVFDPLCGAGTTCKMALLNNRHYLGMEVHEPYWEYAKKRLRRARQEYVHKLIDGFAQ
ncbi:MAG: site-specific DNA-methyltransferase [Thermoguttaceae bacterium]|nr:site-specific DNA-methyltransferase [Thermoguttaceae bacterium]